MRQLRAAAIQLRSGIEPAANRAAAIPLLREAAAAGARLIATPENTLRMDRDRARMLGAVGPEQGDGELLAWGRLAQELGVWLLLGSAPIATGDGKVFNRSFLFSDEGKIAARYDKINLFDVTLGGSETYRESDTVQGGDKAVLVEGPMRAKIGLSICYDLRFAPLYSAYAKAGAEIITVPAAFTVPTGQAHWETLLRARGGDHQPVAAARDGLDVARIARGVAEGLPHLSHAEVQAGVEVHVCVGPHRRTDVLPRDECARSLEQQGQQSCRLRREPRRRRTVEAPEVPGRGIELEPAESKARGHRPAPASGCPPSMPESAWSGAADGAVLGVFSAFLRQRSVDRAGGRADPWTARFTQGGLPWHVSPVVFCCWPPRACPSRSPPDVSRGCRTRRRHRPPCRPTTCWPSSVPRTRISRSPGRCSNGSRD
jgi:predicted amidohydrolase